MQWTEGVEGGQVRVEQAVEARSVVEVVGGEVAGGQTVVVRGQVMMEKARQVGMMLGEVARPCQ